MPRDAPASFSTSIWAMTTITKEGDCGEEGVERGARGDQVNHHLGTYGRERESTICDGKKSWKMGK